MSLALMPRGVVLYAQGILIAYRTTPVDGEPAELWSLQEPFRNDPKFISMFVDERMFLEQYGMACMSRIVDASESELLVVAPPWVSLEPLIRHGTDPGGVAIELVVTLVCDLARDLATLPDDVVLRSLSPNTLAINMQGRPRFLDATLARFDGRTTQTEPGVIKGSLAYLSPELATGRPLSAKSDLFTLGVIAYQLLCGSHPFLPYRSNFDLLARISDANLPSVASQRAGLPRPLVRLVDGMLARAPEDRPSAAEILATIERELAAFLWSGERMFAAVTAIAPAEVEAAILYGF